MLAFPLALLAAGVLAAPASPPAPSPVSVPSAATVPALPGAGRSPGARWGWPLLPAPVVLRGFDDVGRYAAGHRGVDLAATAGAPVLAPAAGRVVVAGAVAGRGVAVLAHPGGLRTSVEPVDALLPVGSEVAAGQAFATVAAAPAHCPTTCLHVGLRSGAGPDVVYLDPLAWFTRAAPPVLLPLGGPG